MRQMANQEMKNLSPIESGALAGQAGRKIRRLGVIVGQPHEGVQRGNRLGLGPAFDPPANSVY